MRCQDCDTLWAAYENAVFEHVRLCSRLKLALAADADENACDEMARDIEQAEQRRSEARTALARHEDSAGHGASSLPVEQAV